MEARVASLEQEIAVLRQNLSRVTHQVTLLFRALECARGSSNSVDQWRERELLRASELAESMYCPDVE